MTLETKHYIRNQRELMKNISVVSASYKGLTLPELSFPHIHFAAMQREEQRLYRSPSLICNNSISLVSNNVSWHRKRSLLCNRHTGTILVNSHRRYLASVSQEKGTCNRNWMQVFLGGELQAWFALITYFYVTTKMIDMILGIYCVCYRHTSVQKSILLELKDLHGVWKTDRLKKTFILWCRLLTKQGILWHTWLLNNFSDCIT